MNLVNLDLQVYLVQQDLKDPLVCLVLMERQGQEGTRVHLEKWDFLVNRVLLVAMGPGDLKVNQAMVLRTPCNEMQAPEVSFSRLPKVRACLVLQGRQDLLEKTDRRETLETFRYSTLRKMLMLCKVHLVPLVHPDLKDRQANEDEEASEDVQEKLQ